MIRDFINRLVFGKEPKQPVQRFMYLPEQKAWADKIAKAYQVDVTLISLMVKDRTLKLHFVREATKGQLGRFIKPNVKYVQSQTPAGSVASSRLITDNLLDICDAFGFDLMSGDQLQLGSEYWYMAKP